MVNELDDLMAKYIGCPPSMYPFSTSDTYIGRVKKKLMKDDINYLLVCDNTLKGNKIHQAVLFKGAFSEQKIYADIMAETENLALCLAIEKMMQ